MPNKKPAKKQHQDNMRRSFTFWSIKTSSFLMLLISLSKEKIAMNPGTNVQYKIMVSGRKILFFCENESYHLAICGIKKIPAIKINMTILTKMDDKRMDFDLVHINIFLSDKSCFGFVSQCNCIINRKLLFVNINLSKNNKNIPKKNKMQLR